MALKWTAAIILIGSWPKHTLETTLLKRPSDRSRAKCGALGSAPHHSPEACRASLCCRRVEKARGGEGLASLRLAEESRDGEGVPQSPSKGVHVRLPSSCNARHKEPRREDMCKSKEICSWSFGKERLHFLAV